MKGTVELKLELISLSEQITCLRAEFVAPVWVLGACGLFVCLVSSVAAVTSAAQGEGGGGAQSKHQAQLVVRHVSASPIDLSCQSSRFSIFLDFILKKKTVVAHFFCPVSL